MRSRTFLHAALFFICFFIVDRSYTKKCFGDHIDLTDYNACGHSALFLSLRLADSDCSYADVQRVLGKAVDGGHSFAQLKRASEALGTSAQAYRDVPIELLPTPCLVHLKKSFFKRFSDGIVQDHFVVVIAINQDRVVVVDAPFPVAEINKAAFAEQFSGNVLKLETAQSRFPWHLHQLKIATLLAAFVALAFLLRRRPRTLIVACLATLGSLYAQMNGASSYSENPSRLLADNYQLGTFAPGKRTASIPILNRTSSSIGVKKILSSCGCVAVVSPLKLLPGSTTQIEMELLVRSGPGSTELVVLLDNGERQSCDVSWIGSAIPRVDPPRIHSVVDVDSSFLAREVKIQFATDSVVKFLGSSSLSRWVQIEPVHDDRGGELGSTDRALRNRGQTKTFCLRYDFDESTREFNDVVTMRFDVDGEINHVEIDLSVFLRDHPS